MRKTSTRGLIESSQCLKERFLNHFFYKQHCGAAPGFHNLLTKVLAKNPTHLIKSLLIYCKGAFTPLSLCSTTTQNAV